MGGGSPLGLAFLVRFDLQQGQSLGSQIYAVTGAPASPGPPPGTRRLCLAATDSLRAARPRAPRDIRVAARRDRVRDIPRLPVDFSPGKQRSLDARVNDAGASLLPDLPWQGTASGLRCVGAGVSNCRVDSPATTRSKCALMRRPVRACA